MPANTKESIVRGGRPRPDRGHSLEEFAVTQSPLEDVPSAPLVGLFHTCLVDLYRPNVGFAAVSLLERAGCRVEVNGCRVLACQTLAENDIEIRPVLDD